uniref:Uncharacterized protein n=1 Tax=Kalanchoe fedtschenkoi TaxID=63787 RepID=A0A7N0ZR73_KALFE
MLSPQSYKHHQMVLLYVKLEKPCVSDAWWICVARRFVLKGDSYLVEQMRLRLLWLRPLCFLLLFYCSHFHSFTRPCCFLHKGLISDVMKISV